MSRFDVRVVQTRPLSAATLAPNRYAAPRTWGVGGLRNRIAPWRQYWNRVVFWNFVGSAA